MTPVKDEYEFDEDDEQDRTPPVDDKHLLKKDYRREAIIHHSRILYDPPPRILEIKHSEYFD